LAPSSNRQLLALSFSISLSLAFVALSFVSAHAQDQISFTKGACGTSTAPTPCASTYHYDNFRTGVQPLEATLIPSLVQSNFGVVPVQGQSNNYYQVDGLIYAQPLYLSGVAMNTTNCPTANGPYNIVLVATENNSLYGLAYTYAKNGSAYQITWTQCWQAQLNKGPVNGSSVTGTAIPFTDLPTDPSTGYPATTSFPRVESPARRLWTSRSLRRSLTW
jgi:hypothetical protein